MFFPKDDNIKLISHNNNHSKYAMRLPRNRRTVIVSGMVIFTLLVVLFKTNNLLPSCLQRDDEKGSMVREEKFMQSSDNKNYVYHRNMPLIFIGGVPRSGTTLMRAMLDAHPEVMKLRCFLKVTVFLTNLSILFYAIRFAVGRRRVLFHEFYSCVPTG